MTRSAPIIHDDSSDAKRKAAPAISEGIPARCMGISFFLFCHISGASRHWLALPLVAVSPGEIVLTLMSLGASSTAQLRVSIDNAALLA